MPRSPKTARVPRSEARLYVAKASEFLESARGSLHSQLSDAAVLSAIHAAISASDAVATALAGRRSIDPDHQRSVDLLEQVAAGSGEISNQIRQLRALLAKKNAVEYESRRATTKEATDAVRRAARFVEWAKATVERAKL